MRPMCSRSTSSPIRADGARAPRRTCSSARTAERTKEVAHLTTGRKSDQAEKQWDISAICIDLFPVIQEFARDADLVCDNFQSDVMKRLPARAE